MTENNLALMRQSRGFTGCYYKENFAIIQKIEQHPAMKLYFTPFWNSVEPILNSRMGSQPFNQFRKMDQKTFDAASAAIEDILLSLGIEFELFSSGQVYVHVDEPKQLGEMGV